MNVLGINSLADIRALLYGGLPLVTTLLVTGGVATDTEAALWGALVTAILGPGIAFWNARNTSTFRTALYAVLVAAQALIIGYGLVDGGASWLPVLSAVIAGIGGGVATINTPVSSAFAKGSNGGLADPNAPTMY